MLVMAAMVGERWRNEPSDSSASATSRSPAPRAALVPSALSLPPMMTVGSRPGSRRTVATSEVVVVLPWEPAMAMPSLSRISSASISARGITGMPRVARDHQLGIVALHRGGEHHHIGARHVLGAVADMHAWPRASASARPHRTRARPSRRPRSRGPSSTSAIPLMPMPPMPTK